MTRMVSPVDACHMDGMDNRERLNSGWHVRVTAYDNLGRPGSHLDFWVGESDKSAAERLVQTGPREKAVGVKPLFISELDGFGVGYHQVKQRLAA